MGDGFDGGGGCLIAWKLSGVPTAKHYGWSRVIWIEIFTKHVKDTSDGDSRRIEVLVALELPLFGMIRAFDHVHHRDD